MILTPILAGQVIDQRVIHGASLQGFPWLIHSSIAHVSGVLREVNINANRQQLQQLARAHKPDFVLLMDSDVVMSHGTLERLKSALSGDVIASCARTQGETSHILAACCLMRWEHYELIRYWDRPDECQCKKIARLGKMVEIECGCYEIERHEKAKL